MSVTTTGRTASARWAAVQPWLGMLARLGLAGVWFAAGASKVTHLAASARAVNAYRLMPFSVAEFVGAVIPFLEIGIGILLLLGLATRLGAIASAVLLAAYVAGISSAWVRGLAIDCGCFGGGGDLAAGQTPSYAPELVRDAGLLVLALFVAVFPRTRWSLDARLLAVDLEEEREPTT